MRKNFICLFFILLFAFINAFHAAAEESYLEQLLELSEEKKLYEDRYWHTLLHYKAGIFEKRSLIDDPRFFIADNGKTNPQSELKETIKSFFSEQIKDIEHPQCRFIARYNWLKEKLNIDETKLPKVQCTEYIEVTGKMKPKSAAFVFPGSFMNRPASMFGHTFIRIDSEYQSKLLGHAVNYSAFTGGGDDMLYAIKGVFGFYKGYYSILPYYEKVKEYNDIDQRDMWEYIMNLSEDELKKMLMHIWELKNLYSYYYFFDENCSYNILFLLEAARPSLNLTDKFGFWVIPIDTVRAVKESGLVDSVNYRASKTTTINHISSLLDENTNSIALQIINGETDPETLLNNKNLTVDEKTHGLDIASEMVQYKYLKGELNKDDYLKRFLHILKIRSQLGKRDDNFYKIPNPVNPENGHLSNRLAVGIGVKKDYLFQEIKIRPAYHDLLDPDEGYREGSQIVFTDIRARYYFENKKFKLEGVDIVDIVSISPMTEFFKPNSWKISTGITQKIFKDGNDHAVLYGNGGYGLAFEDNSKGLYYILAESDIYISRKLEDKYSVGIGITPGIIKPITRFWKITFSLEALHYFAGDKTDTYKGTFNQNFRISQNNSISLNLSRIKTYTIYQSEAILSWNLYF